MLMRVFVLERRDMKGVEAVLLFPASPFQPVCAGFASEGDDDSSGQTSRSGEQVRIPVKE